jgi:hypothetical protein
MNLFNVFLSTYDFDIKEAKNFLISFCEFISSRELNNNKNPYALLTDNFLNLPDAISKITKNTNFGWVPNLPNFCIQDIFETLTQMNSQSVADKIMLKKLNTFAQKKLFKILQIQNKKYGHVKQTIIDAINSFHNKCYTACALCLFALIDSCFIKGQPFKEKGLRNLSGVAIDKIGDNNLKKYSLIASLSCMIIKSLFEHSNDFIESNERGIKRNFISHGMNKNLPNKVDCLKLFVLLYNIYYLFDSELFKWETINLK